MDKHDDNEFKLEGNQWVRTVTKLTDFTKPPKRDDEEHED